MKSKLLLVAGLLMIPVCVLGLLDQQSYMWIVCPQALAVMFIRQSQHAYDSLGAAGYLDLAVGFLYYPVIGWILSRACRNGRFWRVAVHVAAWHIVAIGLAVGAGENKIGTESTLPGRDRLFYQEIAASCDALLSPTNHFAPELVVPGDSKVLPTALQNLHPTTVKVANHLMMGSNSVSGVLIIFGETRPNHVVSWEQNNYGSGKCPWELSLDADGKRTILFSTKP